MAFAGRRGFARAPMLLPVAFLGPRSFPRRWSSGGPTLSLAPGSFLRADADGPQPRAPSSGRAVASLPGEPARPLHEPGSDLFGGHQPDAAELRRGRQRPAQAHVL